MSQILNTASQCLRDEAEAILAMVPRLDGNFEKAVEIILGCKGKCIVTGVGKSGHIGRKIAATLASTGTPAFFLNPLDAYHGDLGMVTEQDVVIAISYSGATDELLRFMPILRAKNVKIIAMSSSADSLLACNADVHLNIAIKHEADPLNLVPTSSSVVTLAMGDALACALMDARHFCPTDFAMLHPGGDLGHKLLAHVSEVMFTVNLPFVTAEDNMQTVIEIMTRGTLGIAIVTDADNCLKGIITDGDIRRAMQRLRQSFFTSLAKDIMTNNPKTIAPGDTIARAGEKMNNNSIHTLIVVDADNKVCGVIDSFSCLPGTRYYH